MRRKRTYLLGAAAIAFAASAVGVVYAAPANQTFEAEIIPDNRAPKKKFVNKGVMVKTTVEDEADPEGIPPKANRVKVSFDRHIRFRPKGFGRCRQARIENTDTETAINRCRTARVGKGNGVAALPLGPGGTRADFPARITAFNGKPAGRKPTVLLHSRVGPPVNATAVLRGVLKNSPEKRFGKLLNVSVPPIADGLGAIAEFKVRVRRRSYVQARCRPNRPAARKWRFKAKFNYTDAPTVTRADRQRCRRR